MRAASCFSGIGGAECALPEADWLWAAEIEDFPSRVLETRFGHPNLGDITAPDFIDRALAFGPIDLLCGGPPCQAFSLAGLRGGMSDPRGQLSLRFLEVLHAVRPRNALVENVPGWLNHEDNAFGCFLGGLVGADDALLPSARPRRGKSNDFWRWRAAGRFPVLDDDGEETGEVEERPEGHVPRWPRVGMVAGPRARAAWRVLDAQYAGLAQRRERVFLVADFGEGADPTAVLFERRGLHGDSPPRREAGESVAGTLNARAQGGGGLGADFECMGGLQPVIGGGPDGGRISGAVSSKWAKGSGGPAGDEVYNMVAHTLRGEGFDASEDGTGRATPIIPEIVGAICKDSFSGGAGGRPEGASVGHYLPVTFPERMSGTQYGTGEDIAPTIGEANPTAVAFMENQRGEIRTSDIASAISRGGGKPGQGYPAVAFDMRGREGGAQFEGSHDTANIRAADGGSSRSYVAGQWAVRRLTVTECERLQGFPDNWTLIETDKRRTVEEDEAEYLAAKGAHVALGNDGKLRTNAAADGPRYKALGNAWAVACVRPIMERIRVLQAKIDGES